MDIVTIDFETFYDRDYSLSKMTTEAYVRDPRFEVIGVGVKVNDEEVDTYSGDTPGRFLKSLDYSKRAILCHNTAFDGAILSWHFGIRPALWLDTLSMARPKHKLTVGGSLKKLADHYQIGVKGTEVVQAMGKRRKDFTRAELEQYMRYCANDVELTYALFMLLRQGFPASELRVIDQTIRMYTEPKIELDRDLLVNFLTDVRRKKVKLLSALGGEKARSHLMSNHKFAKLLTKLGVEPPTKLSPTTGKETYAFAKTDKGLTDLLEHVDPRVAAVVSARLGVKSTLEETRTEALIGVSERGKLPIMLNYYGAHCVPGDTEVLTHTGWERLDRWEGGKVAQWSESGRIDFIEAKRFVGPVLDDWVVSKAPYMPIEMSLGHKVPVLGHGNRKLKPLQAVDLLSRSSSYIPTSGWLRNNQTFTETQTRVLVMVQADGSYELDGSKGRRLAIFVKKPRKIERARKLLSEANVPYEEQEYASCPGYVRFIVRARDYPEWLKPSYKLFGSWVLGCDLVAFIDEIPHWDGWIQGGQACYSTSDEANKEWVQTVAHLAGKGCSTTTRKGEGNRRINYVLRFRNRAECMVKIKHLSVEKKSQQAFCVESQTGYWLARANGHIFVTGNTGRFSGGDGLNLQNLPGRSSKVIRRALCAPEGEVILACDLSQIEARVLAWLAGQEDLTQAFRDGRDVYSEFATDVFGRTITKADKKERFVGKTAILGLGYGCGAVKFREMLRIGKVDVDLEEAKRIVDLYRQKNDMIKRLWNRFGWSISSMINGDQSEIGCVKTGLNQIILPNKLSLQYPYLQSRDGEFYYLSDPRNCAAYERGEDVPMSKWVKLYGGKICENVTQALATIIMKEYMTKVGRKYPLAFQVHDEIVLCVSEKKADAIQADVESIMSKPPKWASDLPVACEAGWAKNYGDVER